MVWLIPPKNVVGVTVTISDAKVSHISLKAKQKPLSEIK